MSPTDLKELLKVSRLNNRRNGISGFLLYQDMSFIQLIEGPDRNVYKLWERIRLDKRHTAVTLILLQNIEQRIFQNWSMGFANLEGIPATSSTTDDSIVATNGLTTLLASSHSNRTLDFLSSFKDRLNKHGDYTVVS